MSQRRYGANLPEDVWLLDELHKMRAYAANKGMEDSVEALRIAIIRVALELGTPTGLSALELSYGLTQMPRASNDPDKA
jgi:hypothetical protein